MATKKTQNVTTTTTNIFSEPETFNEVVEETTVEEAPIVVAPGAPAQKKARVKGTWLMHWGGAKYNFEDGKTYTIPADLYAYLQAHENIYDTI
jgi:hypothetical protein